MRRGREIRRPVLATLSRVLENRDPATRGHAARVAALARAVALRLGWDEQRLATLELGARLHDIGKVVVPASILRKAGPLEPHEVEQIRRHPEAGARLLRPVPSARSALPSVLYHHERWDGAGYPHRVAGDAIPLEARVLALADAFDAMTSFRPYRRSFTTARALEEVDRCAGTQFDPRLARTFVEVVEIGGAVDVTVAAG
jgi:HD-GYP domain-containing protein (c-di-GMP phosphodiesterase class II)